MKKELNAFKQFLTEKKDPAYHQETFNFIMLISMDKDRGGSRDETKNDIRAFEDVLTVTLVEKEKGGIQQAKGNKYISSLKIHTRIPKGLTKEVMMKRIVKQTNALKGVTVLRAQVKKKKVRKKQFRGAGSYQKRVQNVTEGDYWQSDAHMADLKDAFKALTSQGPQTSGGYETVEDSPDFKSAPPGAPFGEGLIREAAKTPADIPAGHVVVMNKKNWPLQYEVYFAKADATDAPLREGPFYGHMKVSRSNPESIYRGSYKVDNVKATEGFGPILYDVAMEIASQDSRGLRADDANVSDDAAAVWKFYQDNRSDVEALEADKETGHYIDAFERGEIDAKKLAEYLAQKGFIPVGDLDTAYFSGDSSEAGEKMVNFVNNKLHLTKIYKKTTKDMLTALKDAEKYVETDGTTKRDAKIAKAKKGLSRFDRLRETIEEAIKVKLGNGDDLMTLASQKELQQDIWDGDKVREEVKAALMDIVDEFIEGLDMGEDIDIKDITLTGSIANYNWSKYSDIDLHIILDFKKVNDNEALVKRFFDAVRSNWNKRHNIKVKGHEVELYVQSHNEPHVSTGVYSLTDDEWRIKPEREVATVNKADVVKKANSLEREIDKAELLYNMGRTKDALELTDLLKNKITNMRKAGLAKEGIFSVENLAFKMLRRSGAIEKLHDINTKSYDAEKSMQENSD